MRLLVLLLVVHQIFADSESGQLDDRTFASGLNGFSYELSQKLEDTVTKNQIYSPLSISMVMGMLLKGAQGKTREDMYKVLNMLEYSNKDSIHNYYKSLLTEYKDMATREKNLRNATLEVANAAMVAESYNLPENFTDALKTDYEASFSKEKFATNGPQIMEKVNKFVSERTHGLIPKILGEPLDASTKLFLLNTVYFKGFWEEPFLKVYTHNSTFYNSDKTESTIEMMTRDASLIKYYHCNVHNASLIELKYKGDISMFVILPDEKHGLPKLVEGWSKNKLASFIPQMKDTRVKVYLPKFENEAKFNLLETLDKMGVNIRPALAPLDATLEVSEAVHKAKIKVFEAGTEAAAVTYLSVTRISAIYPTDPVIFRADHPFVYAIRDMKSNVNLFVGCLNNFN